MRNRDTVLIRLIPEGGGRVDLLFFRIITVGKSLKIAACGVVIHVCFVDDDSGGAFGCCLASFGHSITTLCIQQTSSGRSSPVIW